MAAESAVIPEGLNPELKTEEPEKSPPPKWPGWPGNNVFRLIVPVLKVGSIIGRKGEFVKKLCDETRARVRVLDAPSGTPDRVVLISGKEEPDLQLSPAMDATLRVFKRISGVDGAAKVPAVEGAGLFSIKLMVALSQAINLIGKQGSTIKAVQESSGAVVRILPEGELPSYAASDERIVEIHGEVLKVLNALEAVLTHLRKFLVDPSIVALFEKNYSAIISQDRTSDAIAWTDATQSLPQRAPETSFSSDYPLTFKSDSYFERASMLDTKAPPSGSSLYFQSSGLGGLHSTSFGRPAAPIVTQVTQTMQVPLSYADDIIGIGGANIAYIQRVSGARVIVHEMEVGADDIIIDVKGSSSEVQQAQQLIQDTIHAPKEHSSRVYGTFEDRLSSYSSHLLSDTTYRPSLSSYSRGGFGSPDMGGYPGHRF